MSGDFHSSKRLVTTAIVVQRETTAQPCDQIPSIRVFPERATYGKFFYFKSFAVGILNEKIVGLDIKGLKHLFWNPGLPHRALGKNLKTIVHSSSVVFLW